MIRGRQKAPDWAKIIAFSVAVGGPILGVWVLVSPHLSPPEFVVFTLIVLAGLSLISQSANPT